jgi:hypothetical protein
MRASPKVGRGPSSSAPTILKYDDKKKSTGWSSVREQLKEWPQPALTALIKDLYDASPANRDFLHARFQGMCLAPRALVHASLGQRPRKPYMPMCQR